MPLRHPVVFSTLLAALALGIGACASAEAGTASRPFPRHTTYTAGTILPNHVSRADLDQAAKTFYSAWKATFVRQGCGTGRYYVATDGRPGAIGAQSTMNVSEGTGLGMLILPHMAGYDPDAQTVFDGLYRFARDHPSQNDPDLMAWRQLGNCASSGDPNSASDGDINIAYGLLLAHAQWGSGGAIAYRTEALRILAAMKRSVIHPTTNLVQMGDWVDPNYPTEYNAVRMSDLMPMQLRAFFRVNNDQDWADTLAASFATTVKLQADWSPGVGLVPDFAVDTASQAKPAPAGFVGEPRAGQYQFNSCRVPWQVGADYLVYGTDARSRSIDVRMLNWLQMASGNDIYRIFGGYQLNGTPTVGWNYVCFTGAFGVGAMVDPRYQGLLNDIWDDVAVANVADPSDYYGSTLRMTYLLVMSGNMWRP